MFAPKNILVPTDFSKYSDKALKEAIDIAVQYGSKIYLLHVIDQQVQECAIDYCLSYEVVQSLKKESLKTAKENLEKEANRIAKGNMPHNTVCQFCDQRKRQSTRGTQCRDDEHLGVAADV